MSDAPAEHTPALPPARGANRHRFPRAARILRSADFERAMKSGVRLVDECLVLWAVANTTGQTRLGLVVGRKHGNAPQRNRLKRVLREAFRLTRPELLPGLDLVCAPRAGVPLKLRDCMESLHKLSRRAAQRLAKT